MASAEKLPSGRWRGRYVDADGKKRWLPGTFPRKSDAIDAAVDEQAKAKRKAAVDKGKLSARTTWADWWAVFSDDRTFTSDTGVIEEGVVRLFVMPRWGDKPLNGIKKKDVQAWLDGLLREGRSINYVYNIFGPLRVSVTAAVDQEVLDANPVAGVKLPKRPKRAKVFTTTDDAAKMRTKMNSRFADAVDFALETGLRPNELAGLHVHRADLDRGWLDVCEVYVQRAKKIRELPKDGDARSVPLSKKAIEIIRRQLDGRKPREGCGVEHFDGTKCKDDLLFRNARGGVLNQARFGAHMREAAREVGVRPKAGYSLRRGFATRAARGGMDAFALADMMGHADVKVTRGYVQESEASRAQLLAALGERPELRAVDPRGPERGPDSDNQASPDVPKEGEENTA